ncbi:MAG: hypothetical protein KF849_18330 [Rhizobiaceae bacterium]|nr:hypothetical protein [Rhizobiaceae bacterium]
MAKGQLRSNKETRKPKKDKAAKATPAASPIKLPEPSVVARGKAKNK